LKANWYYLCYACQCGDKTSEKQNFILIYREIVMETTAEISIKAEGLIRAFVAVVPPEELVERMTQFVGRLRPLAPWKWVGRAQLHLTLRFLGETPAAQVERVRKALTGIEADGAFDDGAFEICMNRAGGFPNLTRPRVLWLGGDRGAKELTALASLVEQASVRAGYPPETKRFSPHLTLARLRNGGESSLPAELLKALQAVPSFSWRCDRFFLMQSRLTPTGPIYTRLQEYRLK
jgi:2'-5' RNA ligase